MHDEFVAFQFGEDVIPFTRDVFKIGGLGGAYGTQSWADPANQTIYILMIQRRGFNNGDNLPVRKAFQATARAALED